MLADLIARINDERSRDITPSLTLTRAEICALQDELIDANPGTMAVYHVDRVPPEHKPMPAGAVMMLLGVPIFEAR